MKKIALFALAAAALAAGCTSDSGQGQLSATWSITIGTQAARCSDVDGKTVEITSIPSNGGTTKVDLFDCSAMSASTSTLPTGVYTVKVRLLDSNNAMLNSVTPTGTFSVTRGGVTNIGNFIFAFQAQAAQGTLSLTWMITRGGSLSTCAAVNGRTLELTSTPVSGGTPLVDQFDCTDMTATTDPVDAGQYHVQIRLLDTNNQQLNIQNPSGIVTVGSNANTPIGNFLFAFTN
jgi:hypothetical protein